MEITKALNDWVVIVPEEEKEQTVGGIILSTKEEKTAVGTVVSVGPGNRNVDTSWVKEGDKVMYMKDVNAVENKSEDGTKQLIIRFSSLYAVVK